MAEYCLRWNNHQPNLVTVFSELLTAESLVDVTLATDGHFIHAHKLVLSACSVYFKDLFGSNPCKHPIVFLKDIRIEDLKTVIDFIYRGEVNVSQERLQDVLKTAESLRIKGLADKPFSYDEYPSQRSGQHHSSSFSSQRSSLTDSREQAQSVDTDDLAEGSGNSPPVTKKRKVATSQDSSESIQDTNHEGEDRQRSEGKDDTEKKPTPTVKDEGVTQSTSFSGKEKVKEESEGSVNQTDSRPEFKESRAADAMLLLQGSSSEGGGDEGGTNPIPASNTRGDHVGGLISSHSQGLRRGRPPRHRGTFHFNRSNPFPRERGVNPFRRETDPYLFANCLIVRPKLKASDGSYVTIRTGTTENFLQAVEDVRDGKMGFCKAGKIYGVNHATLQKFYKAMGYHVRNRSNNPNFIKSPPDSEREENDGDSIEGVLRQQDYDPYRYGTYTPPRALYQHFMTPHIDHAILTTSSESSRGEGAPKATTGTGTFTTSATTSASHHKSTPATSLTDSLSRKLESYTTGRLLNYASLYCEAIGVSDDADKDPLPPPIPLPPSGSNSQEQSSSDLADQQILDINHPIVLCNL